MVQHTMYDDNHILVFIKLKPPNSYFYADVNDGRLMILRFLCNDSFSKLEGRVTTVNEVLYQSFKAQLLKLLHCAIKA